MDKGQVKKKLKLAGAVLTITASQAALMTGAATPAQASTDPVCLPQVSGLLICVHN